MNATRRVHTLLASSADTPTALLADAGAVRWLRELEALVELQQLPHLHVRKGHPFRVWRDHTWSPLTSADHLHPGDLLRVKSSHNVFKVLSLQRTHFRVNMACLLHPPSHTLCVVFTGLQSRAIGAGAHVTCLATTRKPPTHTSPFLLPEARVHEGLYALSQHFSQSKAWAAGIAAAADTDAVRHVVVSGFSMGAAMSHILSMELRSHLPAPTTLTVVAHGAPRTGNHAWAESFAKFTPTFAHVNLVAGTYEGSTVGDSASTGISVDEVVTMPLHAAHGFTSCLPQVVVLDAKHAFVPKALATQDLWGIASQLSLCVHSVLFIRGFSAQHRMVLPSLCKTTAPRASWTSVGLGD